MLFKESVSCHSQEWESTSTCEILLREHSVGSHRFTVDAQIWIPSRIVLGDLKCMYIQLI